jgi:hypothetical protein
MTVPTIHLRIGIASQTNTGIRQDTGNKSKKAKFKSRPEIVITPVDG